MSRFSSVRVRLVGTVLLAVAPAFAALVYAKMDWLWPSFAIGLLALAAAWFGGELFVLRQVRSIHLAARKLASGDLTSRTGLSKEPTELGELARSLDVMAATMERNTK